MHHVRGWTLLERGVVRGRERRVEDSADDKAVRFGFGANFLPFGVVAECLPCAFAVGGVLEAEM